jgi:hypothetical protein
MSGQIFISYRRDDSSAWARLVHDRLSQYFSPSKSFMDVDAIKPSVDLVEAIAASVGSWFLRRADRGYRKALANFPY